MKNTQVAFITLVISVIVLILKTKAYYATLSLGIMSDALETVVNVITALTALAAVKIAAAPADEDHPYGHGKLEYFSAAFEGGLILFAGLAILFQSLQSFFITTQELKVFDGNLYLFLAAAINLGMGLYLNHFGKTRNSEALQASGRHLLTDVVTTVGVFAGLVLVHLTNLMWIDGVVAFAVGLYLLFEAYKILQSTTGALMDAVDVESLNLLAGIINRFRVAEVIDIHNTRIIRSGNFHHIDAHIVVPEYLDVGTVHKLTHEFEMKVVKDYRYEGEIAFHIDPCKRSYCKQCEISNCKIRAAEFEKIKKWTLQDITKGPSYTNTHD